MNGRNLYILAALGLTGCATLPPATAENRLCAFRMEAFVVDDPEFRVSDDAVIVPPRSTLILSGGGEKGAFGAGFLTGWAEGNGGKLPDFDLVTGISTGAILATWAFVGDHKTVADEYRIERESDILKALAKPAKGGGLGLGAATKLLRANSLGDLAPLRQRLQALLTPDLLRTVANRPGSLKVGAVEVDQSELWMFDLKEMAARAVSRHDANDQAGFEHFRDCYTDAILASSSVPVGAKPVFIDNRMYIDGGVRQGIFVDFLSRMQRRVARSQPPGREPEPLPPHQRPPAPAIYIIMNGTQWAEQKCGRLADEGCDFAQPISVDPVRKKNTVPHKKWQIADLAFRTTDILGNQIYRFSAKRTEEQYKLVFPAERFQQRFYFVRMHRRDLKGDPRPGREKEPFRYTIGTVTRTCPEWQAADKADTNPLQFHPRYMACLQAYGRKMAEQEQWYRPDLPARFESLDLLE